MKSNAFKMMIFLVATALLCFGTTMTVSASVNGGDDEPVIEESADGGAVESGETVEATDEDTDDSEMTDGEETAPAEDEDTSETEEGDADGDSGDEAHADGGE